MVCRHDLERTSWAQRFRNLVRAVGAWGCLLGPLTWGVAPGWYGPGLWPASLRATDAARQPDSLAMPSRPFRGLGVPPGRCGKGSCPRCPHPAEKMWDTSSRCAGRAYSRRRVVHPEDSSIILILILFTIMSRIKIENGR